MADDRKDLTRSLERASASDIEAEAPPTHTRVVRLGGRHVLVARPHSSYLGRQAIEILCTLAYARRMGLPVCFLWPSTVTHEALLEVTSPEVRILTVRRVPDSIESARSLPRRIGHAARYAMVVEMGRWLRRSHILPPAARTRIGARHETLSEKVACEQAELGSQPAKDARLLVADPVSTSLTERAERRALELAASFGLDSGSQLVCLHVRERGYTLHADSQDKKPGGWDDSVRNAHIEACLPTVDHLVGRGYTVIRMGDPTMTPVTRPGLIDLATSPKRDPLLELWCLFHSRFIIAAESGPLWVSYLTNTPSLTLNATNPTGTLPVRPDSLYVLKEIVDRETGRPLLPSALLSEEHLRHLRDPERHRFVENTPAQIVGAMEEMLELLDCCPSESPGQSWYRELVAEAARRSGEREYVGRGRLVRLQADRWFELEARQSPPPIAPVTPPAKL